MSHKLLFYIDTNCLVYAKHYFLCQNLAEDFYPQGVRTGKIIVEALDICTEKHDLIDIRASQLANFEINRRFRSSAVKRVFLQYGIPLEAIDGRPQDILANINNRPPDMLEAIRTGIEDDQNWYLNWDYRRIVSFESIDPMIFTIATSMPFWSPGIDFMDALHVAIALNLGANYFVSDDGALVNHAEKIISEAVSVGKLPNGEVYPRGDEIHEPMKAIKPGAFKDIVGALRVEEAGE